MSQATLRSALRAARPRRGRPADTRERLVAVAAAVFNRDGYYGTDSNRIATEAGYAAGTFYKHFADKQAVFVAAYETWVTAEWRAIETAVLAGGDARELASRIVALVVDLHARWRGLRASFSALVAADAEVRRAHRRQRRRQLEMLAELRRRIGAKPRGKEDDALLLFAIERTCDALAQGEVRDLGLRREAVVAAMRDLVAEALV